MAKLAKVSEKVVEYLIILPFLVFAAAAAVLGEIVLLVIVFGAGLFLPGTYGFQAIGLAYEDSFWATMIMAFLCAVVCAASHLIQEYRSYHS